MVRLLACILLALASFTFDNQEADARGRLRSFVGRGLAHGGAKTAGSITAQKTYGPDVLTVTELSECLKSAAILDARDDEIEKAGAAINVLKRRAEDSDAALRSAEITVDTSSKYSVDRFNDLVRRHNELVIEGKALVASFNADVTSHNQNVSSYNLRCGKKYYESDIAPAKQMAGIP